MMEPPANKKDGEKALDDGNGPFPGHAPSNGCYPSPGSGSVISAFDDTDGDELDLTSPPSPPPPMPSSSPLFWPMPVGFSPSAVLGYGTFTYYPPLNPPLNPLPLPNGPDAGPSLSGPSSGQQEVATASAINSNSDEQSHVSSGSGPWHPNPNPNATLYTPPPLPGFYNFRAPGYAAEHAEQEWQDLDPDDPMPTLNRPATPHTFGPRLTSNSIWHVPYEDRLKQQELHILNLLQQAKQQGKDERDPDSGVPQAVHELLSEIKRTKDSHQQAPSSYRIPELGSAYDFGKSKVGEAVVRRSTRIRKRERKVSFTSRERWYSLEELLAMLLKQSPPLLGRQYRFIFGPVNHTKIAEVLDTWLTAAQETSVKGNMVRCEAGIWRPLREARPWAATFNTSL